MSSHEIMYCDIHDEIANIKSDLDGLKQTMEQINRRLQLLNDIRNSFTAHSDFAIKELLDHRKMMYDLKITLNLRLLAIEKKMPGKLKKKLEKSCSPLLGCLLRGS